MKESIGSLKYIYLEEIQMKEASTVHSFIINATAEELAAADEHNYIPIIIKEISADSYEVIGNSFIYEVAQAAGLERVWCIVTDGLEETISITKLLSREKLPKINLSTAERDEIVQALDYLINLPESPLKKLDKSKTTSKISDSPIRKYWKNLDEITKLKCGITKGKKLNLIKEIFSLAPEPFPAVIKDPAILDSMTTSDLKALSKKRGLSGYSKLKKSQLVELLSQ